MLGLLRDVISVHCLFNDQAGVESVSEGRGHAGLHGRLTEEALVISRHLGLHELPELVAHICR